MKLNAYQQQATTTARYPNIGQNLNYTVLGLVGELGELLLEYRAEASSYTKCDEAGDCLWYIALTAKELGMKLSEVCHIMDIYVEGCDQLQQACVALAKDMGYNHEPVLVAVATGCSIANVWKKTERDDYGELTEKRKNALKMHLAQCLVALCIYLNDECLALESVARYNIEKLAA